MSEPLRIRNTTCDYISNEEFTNLLANWLTGNSLYHIVTLNPEMVVAAESDAEFAVALKKSDIRVPDGSGLIWARWYLRSDYWSLIPSMLSFIGKHVERIAGVDAIFSLARLAQQQHASMYLLGGGDGQAQKTAALLKEKFPDIEIHTSQNHQYSVTGPDDILKDIQQKAPAILLVAYGAPKQTLWIENHRDKLPSVRIAIGVGGAFSILSETTPRAPKILQSMNLEWVWRLILEPKRLPRIYNAVVRFPLLIRQQKISR